MHVQYHLIHGSLPSATPNGISICSGSRPTDTQTDRGTLKCGNGKHETVKNTGVERQDWKTRDQIVWVENAGLENPKTNLAWMEKIRTTLYGTRNG